MPDDLAEAAAAAGVAAAVCDAATLTDMCGMDAHQGVVAETTPLQPAPLETILDRGEIVVALDGVSDPRNLGAVIRVAEALGGDGLILQDRRRAPLSATAQKAAAGAAEWLPVAAVTNLTTALVHAKDMGMWVVGLEAEAPSLQECALLDEKIVLVAGSEGSGLRRRVRETCDALAGIPLLGQVRSLNVATAVAVAAFEAASRPARSRRRNEAPDAVSPPT